MYVVRISLLDREPDFKAFSARPDAERRFRSACVLIPDGDVTAAGLFEVPDTDDARRAVAKVKEGSAILLDRDRYPELRKGAEELIEEWIREGKLPSPDKTD